MDKLPTQEELDKIKHHIVIHKKTKWQKFKRKLEMFCLDHYPLGRVINYLTIIFVTFISAFAFAFGFRAFISPGNAPALVSGGASGVAQVLTRLLEICGLNFNAESEKNIQSLFYFLVNVPLFFLAWFKIGKKFAIITFINVILTSILIQALPDSWVTIFETSDTSDIVTSFKYDYIARGLAGGVTTGISSGLSYVIGTSTGGIDIIAFAIAEKKSTGVGKYSAILNCITVICYTLFNAIKVGGFDEITMTLYTLIYFITNSKVTDIINIKNQKTEIQINTSDSELGQKLMRIFPHGCTIVDAIGGYTGKPRKLIYMTVSSSEVKQVINFVKELDEHAFVNVIQSHQVFGNFYIKPLK